MQVFGVHGRVSLPHSFFPGRSQDDQARLGPFDLVLVRISNFMAKIGGGIVATIVQIAVPSINIHVVNQTVNADGQRQAGQAVDQPGPMLGLLSA